MRAPKAGNGTVIGMVAACGIIAALVTGDGVEGVDATHAGIVQATDLPVTSWHGDTASDYPGSNPCGYVAWSEVTPAEWTALLAEGWQGRDDGTDDVIYSPTCRA